MSGNKRTRLYDISVALSPVTPPWPGDTPYSCGWPRSISAGASVNVSSITSSPHVGTHADAPLHVRNGAEGTEKLALDSFIGRATVVDVSSHSDEITLDVINDALAAGPVERLLLRTNRSIADGSFPGSWPHLNSTALRSLLARGLKLLGVDCPSVDPQESKTLDIHHLLFDGGAAIIENLDLRAVKPGTYELIAFPVKLSGADAAPLRAVLRPI